MDLPLLLRPSLLRSLFLRTLAVAVVPLLVLALAILYVSDQVALDRFQEESAIVAASAAKDIAEYVVQTTRNASLISEIQQTREALASRDQQRIKAQLLPLKSRLGLDIVNFADRDGLLIAGAQDPRPNEAIRPELLLRVQAQVESAWIIGADDRGGLTLRAVAPVRLDGELIGVVEVGAPLDAAFLQRVKRASGEKGESGALTPELALIWGGRLRAATFDLGMSALPTPAEVDASPRDELVRQVTIGGQAHQAIYKLVETHQHEPAALGAFLSLEPVEAGHRTVVALLVVLIAALVLVIGYVAYRFARRITSPIGALAVAAQRIEAGDLATRIEQHSPHEIGTLERAFGTMTRALDERERANRELVAELQVQALNDSLTSLPNRILLQDRLRQMILSAKREEGTFAFFMMDLDRFKEVNDTFGHQMGDRLLVAIGERLRETMRQVDTVARFGGDEFAILLPTAGNPEDAITVARKIQRSLERTVSVGELSLNVDASIGITLYPEHGDDASTLIKRADAAMYVAKRNKSGYAMYQTSEESASRDRLVLMGGFREAIERDELVLHYQPEMDPRTGEVRALEALVRWQHPAHGLLGPDQFIPFAEQTGLIRPLTEWVIKAALEQSRLWHEAGRPVHLAINLSARDFQDPLLPEHVEEALRRADVPPGHLKLEITEGVVMAEAARSLETLSYLHDMGVQLSIDDFGTGYSSLSYLKRLPVDEIKIDRSFVIDISADSGAAAIVRSTIELAHNLGRTVVAEGAEDEATVALLASFDCDSVQGYYYSGAVPVAKVDHRLDAGEWVLGDGAARGRRPRLRVVGARASA